MPIQPENINFLHDNKFQLSFSILPGITYFMNEISLPGLTLPTADFQNPHSPIKIHGDTLQFDKWSIGFNVDEDFNSWLEIFNWMNGLGKPRSFDQFKSRKAKENLPKGVILPQTENAALYSDATLLIQSSSKNTKIIAQFSNIHPISLAPLQFTSKESDVNILISSATFDYDYYTIEVK